MYLPQVVTWYTREASDGRGGVTFTLPVGVQGRWEQGQNLVRNVRGDEIVTNHVVYLECDVAIGDYLVQGTTDETDPVAAKGLEVKAFFKTPSLGGTEFTRKALL